MPSYTIIPFYIPILISKYLKLIHFFFKKVEVVEVQEVQAPEVQAMEVPVQKAAQPIPKVKKARPSVH